jgi:hypothetical protein
MREHLATELANGVALAGTDHEIIRAVLLKHEVHRAHVVFGVAPVANGIEVPR